MANQPVDFLTFFILWARIQGWEVPLLHVRICMWLQDCKEPERVLMVFRGAAKSTIYAVFKAWKLYRDPTRRSLVWSADGPTAEMLTADVINVLRNHPLTAHLLGGRKPGKKRFWVNGARDARNASMRAVGVDSNATGARATDVDFDDVEVPGNIETPEARLKLRNRISDSTHILVPGGQATYIGTPHTSDSIYPEQIENGAAVLKIPLFKHQTRFESKQGRKELQIPFDEESDGLYVLAGIHKGARLLEEGKHYVKRGNGLILLRAVDAVIDVYSGCAWPERFNRAEIALRRKKTRTLNAWDSQYMLEAKPLNKIRLNPEKLKTYDVEPVIRSANGEVSLWLGKVRIVAAALRWDPSSGKLKSDVSALALVLQDEMGCRYWHRATALSGEVAVFADDGKTIIGGQVLDIVKMVKQFCLMRVTVETNGIGGFAPVVLKAALKQAKVTGCGVSESHSSANKNKRILEAWEDPLSSGTIWAHSSVIDGPAWEQLRDWNPAVTDQADDYIDAAAGAISETPERIGRVAADSDGWNSPPKARDDWRPSAGVHEVELEG